MALAGKRGGECEGDHRPGTQDDYRGRTFKGERTSGGKCKEEESRGVGVRERTEDWTVSSTYVK